MLPQLPPDPYKILGVDKKAQTPEIRTAYRKKVLTCHPDKVGPLEDEKVKEEKLAEFQRVQQAYEILNDEEQRSKYDDQVRLVEMRKEMAKNMANTSAPRSPAYHMKVNVRTAEPRSSSFGSGSMPRVVPVFVDKAYGSPPKDDYLYVASEGLRRGERGMPARRDSRDEDRDRDRDRSDRDREKARRRREKEERELQRDREEDDRARRERERNEDLRRTQEKEAARRERKKRDEKERGKDRKHERKSRHKSPAVLADDFEEEIVYTTSKRKSSSRKHEDKYRERYIEKPQPPEDDVKMEKDMGRAMEYLMRRKTGERTKSFDSTVYGASPPAAPTPPPAPAMDSPFRPPSNYVQVEDESDEDMPQRSRATPRRGSYGMSHSTERLGHKKSYSSSREEPIGVFSASPTNRGSPMFAHAATTPPTAADSPPRVSIHRAQTFQPERPAPVPLQSFRRAETFDVGESRGRHRTRMVPQVVEVLSEGDEEEEEDELEERRLHHHKEKRRSRKAHSPDPIPSYSRSHKSKLGREKSYRDTPERMTTTFYTHVQGSVRVVPADAAYYSRSGSSAAYPAAKVKTGKSYDQDDVQYASYTGRGYPPAVAVGDGGYYT